MTDKTNEIDTLISRAASTHDSADAMRFSQAACNIAAALSASSRRDSVTLSDEQIKHMAEQFLRWKLPANFNPDCGISFAPEYNVEYNAQQGKPPAQHEPTGTNLFDYTQAEQMVRFMIEGIPQ